KPKIKRSLLHTISRHSNWRAENINQFIRTQKIYADLDNWRDFVRFLLVGGGMAFLVSGIIFFFAYNWADMHKFTKLGLVQGVLVLMVLASVFFKIDKQIQNIVLTGASMLVGAVFAVFGQIYQTGADAYDLFLGWTLFIALWVFVSNFPPLWFIFLGLVNLTVGLYSEQVASDWPYYFLMNILFIVNMVALLFLKWQEGSALIKNVPKWLERIIIIVSIGYLTTSVCFGLFDERNSTALFLSVFLIVLTYGIGIWYGQKAKDTFYVAAIGFSMIVVTTSILIRVVEDSIDEGVLLVVGGFVVGSISFLVMLILRLNKKWYGK
ncbi:MAG: DUF2157 domain-containing protein, partial [Bacteroidota bacterium]